VHRYFLNRRQFSARCAAFGLTLPLLRAVHAVPSPAQVRLPDGTTVPALGQGAWHLGQGRHPSAVEEEAIRTGVALGMTLLDTSGNYGDGRSEQLIGRVIAGQRDRVFLVSKVEAGDATGDAIARACAASLSRLGTGYLDLYLLHWPVASQYFPGVVAAFEQLRAAGRIRAWGVSNFNVSQMEALFGVPDGHRCATNQVPYSLYDRRIEQEVLPWCLKHNMPVMAYSPLGGDNSPLVDDGTLARIGTAHGCSAAAVALAWLIRSGKIIAIPESGSPAHVRANAAALATTLTAAEVATLEATYPLPSAMSQLLRRIRRRLSPWL
jgi:diketogulonate reductase-like aldo/keto reductase